MFTLSQKTSETQLIETTQKLIAPLHATHAACPSASPPPRSWLDEGVKFSGGRRDEPGFSESVALNLRWVGGGGCRLWLSGAGAGYSRGSVTFQRHAAHAPKVRLARTISTGKSWYCSTGVCALLMSFLFSFLCSTCECLSISLSLSLAKGYFLSLRLMGLCCRFKSTLTRLGVQESSSIYCFVLFFSLSVEGKRMGGGGKQYSNVH